MKERQKEKGIRGNGVGLWREAAGASGADGLVGVAGGSSGGWVGAVDVCSWAAVGGGDSLSVLQMLRPQCLAEDWTPSSAILAISSQISVPSRRRHWPGISQLAEPQREGSCAGRSSGPRARSQLPARSGAQVPGLRVRALGPRGAAPRAPTQEP